MLVTHALRAEGFDASEDGTGRGTPLVPVCFDTTQITSAENRCNPRPGDPSHPLASGAHPPAIAFSSKDHGADAGDTAPTLRAMGHADRSDLSCRRILPLLWRDAFCYALLAQRSRAVLLGGHQFDWEATKALIGDPEVQEWLKEMRKLAFVPEPRIKRK